MGRTVRERTTHRRSPPHRSKHRRRPSMSNTNEIREIFEMVKKIGPVFDFDRVCVRDEAELDFIPRRPAPLARPFSAVLPVLGVPVIVDETMPARTIELRLGDE